ncbi:MAG: hypothetical protein IT450_09075 [Phycisphaerales bacterium]|nr:hypothetical protein [Phycisphaerales bacterium]
MGVAPTTPEPVVSPVAASQLVEFDVPCAECGYNLRTLPTDGRCPECAHAVADSLRLPLTWPSSLSGVRRAMRIWIVGVVICTASMLLVWLFLRFWFPLSLTYPLLADRTLTRSTFMSLYTLDLVGGLVRVASMMLLLVSIRRKARLLAWAAGALLFATALADISLIVTHISPAVISPITWNNLWSNSVALAPPALWLGAFAAWWRLGTSVNADQFPRMRRAALCGTLAAAVLLISSAAHALVVFTVPGWWADNRFWSSRFFVWSGNGAIEKTAEVLLLAAALAFIRQGRRPRCGAGSPVAV